LEKVEEKDRVENLLPRRNFLRSALAVLAMAAGTASGGGAASSSGAADRVNCRLLDGGACRGCGRMMAQLIRRRSADLARVCSKEKERELIFAIGRFHNAVPKTAIAVGDCAEILRGKTRAFVPGCVPTEEDVLSALRKLEKKNGGG
jgi:hypothetical protein